MTIGYDAKRIFHNNRLKPDGQRLVERLPDTTLDRLFSSLWRSKGIVKQLVKDKISLYHGLTGELPVGIEKTEIKTVVTIHDLIFIRYPELYKAIDRKIYTRKFKHAAKTADVVVAISEQTKQDIVDFLNIEPEKIKVLYQGCHPVFKETLSDNFIESTLKKHRIPENYLFYVGSLIERKNALSAVKAIEKTGDHLVLLGQGNAYYNKVKQYVDTHHLNNKVLFLNGLSMEEIAVLYQKANIFIYPSSFEGFGIPIIEALYSKTPVITGKGSCFPEAGGPDTCYVNPHDIDQIVHAIQNIKQDHTYRQKMIDKGFDYVQRFNDEVIAKKMMTLYSSIL